MDHGGEGTLIGGRFALERLVGQGGMGTVYRAADKVSGERVALKLLRGEEEASVDRFIREATLLARLEHSGIVRYVAHGVALSGQHYLAMEWLEGEDLATRLTRGPLTIPEALLVAKRTAEALSYLHGRGVVHRDLKPANLYVPEGDLARTKLIDLGIARAGDRLRMTRTGALVGTPAYMAPEQARGNKTLDGRVDVFALGCVLFECLAGQPAFFGDSVMAVLAKILLEPSPRLSDRCPEASAALDELVARLLRKDPEERPADAGAVLSAIAALGTQDERSLRAQPRTVSRPVALSGAERRLLSVVIAAPPAFLAQVDDTAAPGGGGAPLAAQLSSLSLGDTLKSGRALPDGVEEAIVSFGGRSDRLVTGALVVTFQSQGSANDLAAKAARCALRLRDVAPDLVTVLVTGRGQLQDAPPIGEVIDRASQLLRAAPGVVTRGVAIDELTAGLLGTGFVVTGSGDVRELVGEGGAEVEPGSAKLLGRALPCIGRERELRTLLDLLTESAEEPGSRAALVIAGPGMGKSRLRGEFTRRALTANPEGEVWFARCEAVSAGAPFAIARQLLRVAAGISPGARADEALALLKARVERVATGADAERIAELLSEPAGCPVPASAASPRLQKARESAKLMSEEVQRAFEDWLLREAGAGPRIVVVEDLHWGDQPSVLLLEGALRVCNRKALFVLGSARPEVADTFPGLWASRGVQEIALRPLGARACEQIVRVVLGEEVDPAVTRRLVERSAGNALYLEELLRAEREGRGGQPLTVLAMLQSRLEALPAELRQVLRAGSILGERFWGGALEALLGKTAGDDELDRNLTELVDRELVTRESEGRFPGKPEFVFHHALLRDAAYAMLTEDDRATGHSLAARWLQSAVSANESGPQAERRLSENAAELANHYRNANENAAAVQWLRKAATRAVSIYAMADAMRHYEDALALLRQERETPETLREMVQIRLDEYTPLFVLHSLAGLPMREACEDAEAMALRLGDLDLAAVARGRLAGHFFGRAEYPKAQALIVDEAARARSTNDHRRLGALGSVLAGIWMQLGEFQQLIDGGAELARTLREAGIELENLGMAYPPYIACCAGEALARGVMGQPEQCAALLAESERTASTVAQPYGLAFNACWSAWAYYCMADGARTLQFAERSLAIGKSSSLPTILCVARYAMGMGLALEGRAKEAIDVVGEGLAMSEQTKYSAFRADAYVALAQAHLVNGDAPSCRSACERARAFMERSSERKFASQFERFLGEAALLGEKPDFDDARAHFEESLRIARAQRAWVFEAQTMLAMADLRSRTNRRDEAREVLTSLAAAWRARGVMRWVDEAERRLAKL